MQSSRASPCINFIGVFNSASPFRRRRYEKPPKRTFQFSKSVRKSSSQQPSPCQSSYSPYDKPNGNQSQGRQTYTRIHLHSFGGAFWSSRTRARYSRLIQLSGNIGPSVNLTIPSVHPSIHSSFRQWSIRNSYGWRIGLLVYLSVCKECGIRGKKRETGRRCSDKNPQITSQA